MARSEAVQDIISQVNPLFLEPHASLVKGIQSLEQRAKNNTGLFCAYYGKKIVAYTSYIVSIPGPLASLIRHINDQIMPNALKLLHVAQNSGVEKHVKLAFAPSIGVVKFADLFESVNDVQWWVNGGAARAYAKKRYCDILAHVFLVPTNLMGIVLFGRDVNPGFMSFLGRWATTVGGVTSRVALAPACYVTLCLAYVCMAADSIHKVTRYYKKISKLESNKDLQLPYGPKIHIIDGVQKRILRFKDGKDKQAKLEQTQFKLKNAAWDLVTSGAKLAISVVALGVLLNIAVCSTVSASPVMMIALGGVAIYGVGRSIYVKHMQDILGKPKVEYEYMHV